jgi:HSP20 family protein
MAELVKQPAVPFAEYEAFPWEPFRAMRDLLRWDPFREMAPLGTKFEAPTFFPSFDVTETKDSYVFKADLPGIKKEDVDITFSNYRLQISGKREAIKETKDEIAYTYERQFGSFARTFTLPETADLDNVKTEFTDGVLTLIVPKKATAIPKKIPIA